MHPDPPAPATRLQRFWRPLASFFDGRADENATLDPSIADRVDWIRILPFLGVHVLCLGVVWVGWSATAVAVAVGLYAVRMFAITAFYHRYFSHRSFKTSRHVQFLGALLANMAGQRGPLWWAAHHRHHHRHSDTPADAHSPRERGFWWSHVFWFTCRRNFRTRWELVRDLAKFRELRFLDRFDWIAPSLLALGLYAIGVGLEAWAPTLGTSGLQLLVWGFGVSTVAVFHATCTINSLGHLFGRQRYATQDESRNSALLAFLTLGEGWHNNHHHYPAATRQGFYWWEIDLTYYVLRGLASLGVVRELRPVPERVRAQRP
ncbi:MAG: acyl-CoA desaturase [Planctomycetota bacterium]